MHFTHTYLLNVDRIETIEDVKIVLKEMMMSSDNPSQKFMELCDYVAKSDLENIKETNE